jgi:hypothetical protein
MPFWAEMKDGSRRAVGGQFSPRVHCIGQRWRATFSDAPTTADQTNGFFLSHLALLTGAALRRCSPALLSGAALRRCSPALRSCR